MQRLWRGLRHWFRVNTFAPAWLGQPWQHPLIGIGTAILSQVLVLGIRQALVQVFPQSAFYNALSLLMVSIIALSWGAGPSVIATLFGATWLAFIILPSQVSTPLAVDSVVISVLIYLLAGFAISALASRTERSRRNAQTLAASLEQERARLETILETIPDAVSLYDARGKLTWLNRKGRQQGGSAPIHQTVEEMPEFYTMRTPSGVPLRVEELPLARALGGETTEGMELMYRGSAGQERPTTVSAAPLFDAQGQLQSVVIVSHDTSQLRQAENEAARRASELEATSNLLQAVIEAITDGVFIYDSQGRAEQINSAGRDFLKLYAPEDDPSQPVTERSTNILAYDENGQPIAQEDFPSARVMRGEVLNAANTVDMVLPTVDGGTLQLNMSGAPIKDINGQQAGAVIVARDVTERRRLQRRTQEALEALLGMAEALVQVPTTPPPNEANARPAANEAAQRLVELTRRMLGCQRVSIAAIESETDMQRPIATVGLTAEEEAFWWNEQPKRKISNFPDPTFAPRLRAGEIIVVDLAKPPYQGRPNPYHVQTMLAAPIRIGERLVGILGLDYGNAIHTFTKEEIALAGAISQLGALVLERERLLRERAEAQARMLALEETNERMDQFLSIISHELRTPVTTIKTGVQLMLRRVTNPASLDANKPGQLLKLVQDQERSLQRTDLQVRRLTHLLDDLIDLARIRTGKLEILAERCDLGALVREVVEEEQITHANRTILLKLPPGPAIEVQADPNRIGQVLTNYLTNALKYSATEQPVQVGLDVEGPQARVWVRDQGPGIPLEEQSHIWELFHRVPGIEVKSGSGIGLGLGLHISRTMITQHHGTVGVESVPGKGSTFWFMLPLAEATRAAAPND
jgi:PAS domain S-box-containing protein